MIIKFKNDRKFHIRPKFQIKEIKKKKIFFPTLNSAIRKYSLREQPYLV